jgi:ubiquinone/menaquinone biosynthesis C-methylase UbiE
LSTSPIEDISRLRIEYEDRANRLASSDIYSPFNPANLFMRHQRQRIELALLRRLGFDRLQQYQTLEVGCGSGGILLDYLVYGALPGQIYGTDLLLDRVQEARVLLPKTQLTCSDGQHLPYADNSFDLTLQYTVFSSILDDQIKTNIASEMMRVCKPNGLIIWYDFWLNPTNPHTKGIRKKEIKNLFPDCSFTFKRITLAPPIARRLVPFSWTLSVLLENLKILNTHYLVAICPLKS